MHKKELMGILAFTAEQARKVADANMKDSMDREYSLMMGRIREACRLSKYSITHKIKYPDNIDKLTEQGYLVKQQPSYMDDKAVSFTISWQQKNRLT